MALWQREIDHNEQYQLRSQLFEKFIISSKELKSGMFRYEFLKNCITISWRTDYWSAKLVIFDVSEHFK
jgi:hypothetical protein